MKEVEATKRVVVAAREDLLRTFSFVPDDRLGWSPSESSRSPLWIVGHCGAANFAMATGMRGESLDAPASPEAFADLVWMAGHDTATREEAVRSIEESTAAVLAALDAMTEERLASSVKMTMGDLPMTLWMTFPGEHMQGHARQIDYLQTVWGDRVDHMG